MQVLWSRAAQTRSSCRCTSCAAAIARRTTTAATKRRLKVGDLFTACYSTILASAAIADARIKEERRKEWDRVIAEAKAGPKIHEADAVGRTNSVPGSSIAKQSLHRQSGFDDWDRPSVARNEVYWTPPKETPLESTLRSYDSQSKRHLEKTLIVDVEEEVTPLGKSDPEVEDDWILQEQPIEGIPFREPKTKLHLDKSEIAVANIVNQLLLKTKAFSNQDSKGVSIVSDISQEMKSMKQRIDLLRNGFTQLPTYSWEGVISVEQQRRDLHKSLHSIFRTIVHGSASIELMIAKVCYNLLVSTAPPSIITYNILIRELSRLNQPDMAQVIIDAYFYNTKLAPTSETARLMLDHYRAQGDRGGFQSIIQRMQGTKGDMRIKKRPLEHLVNPIVQQWALQNKVIHRQDFLRAKMPRDSSIFDCIIRGNLAMRGVRPAIRFIRAALRENRQIRGDTFCAVVEACTRKMDYKAGERLVASLVLLWSDGEPTSLVKLSDDVRYGIHQLLALCGLDSSLNTILLLPSFISRRALENMVRHMQLDSLNDALQRFGNLMLSVGSTLGMDRSPTGRILDSQNVRSALQILDRSSESEAERDVIKKQACRWARLGAMDSRLTKSGKRNNELEDELLSIMFEVLSAKSQPSYDPHSRSVDRLAFLSRLLLQERNSSELELAMDYPQYETGGSVGSSLPSRPQQVGESPVASQMTSWSFIAPTSPISSSRPQRAGESSLALELMACSTMTLGN